ncbi:hypothetical protein LJR296_007576 [Cupriavidus necator]|uniref:hypothetical protein n=1 Tax=Cupriavidus necator TaxID=106590 RepID=UPI003ECC31F4
MNFTPIRTMPCLSRGQAPGPEASACKVVGVGLLQEMAAFGMDLAGQAGAVMNGDLAPMQAWRREVRVRVWRKSASVESKIEESKRQ